MLKRLCMHADHQEGKFAIVYARPAIQWPEICNNFDSIYMHACGDNTRRPEAFYARHREAAKNASAAALLNAADRHIALDISFKRTIHVIENASQVMFTLILCVTFS